MIDSFKLREPHFDVIEFVADNGEKYKVELTQTLDEVAVDGKVSSFSNTIEVINAKEII